MNETMPIEILNILDDEYINIIKPIITNEEFLKRKYYHHHENRSVYGHSLMVSIRSYKLAKKLGLDYKSAAIAGLLHDFYYKDWQDKIKKEKFFQKHGFTHANEALLNSRTYFPELLNERIENAILRHMFPLNKIPPKYIESWIITVSDKYVSLEVFKNPKELPSLIGLKRKVGVINE